MDRPLAAVETETLCRRRRVICKGAKVGVVRWALHLHAGTSSTLQATAAAKFPTRRAGDEHRRAASCASSMDPELASGQTLSFRATGEVVCFDRQTCGVLVLWRDESFRLMSSRSERARLPFSYHAVPADVDAKVLEVHCLIFLDCCDRHSHVVGV